MMIGDPVSYLDILALEKNARMILIDSGRGQREAFSFSAHCRTLREEMEGAETLETE